MLLLVLVSLLNRKVEKRVEWRLGLVKWCGPRSVLTVERKTALKLESSWCLLLLHELLPLLRLLLRAAIKE